MTLSFNLICNYQVIKGLISAEKIIIRVYIFQPSFYLCASTWKWLNCNQSVFVLFSFVQKIDTMCIPLFWGTFFYLVDSGFEFLCWPGLSSSRQCTYFCRLFTLDSHTVTLKIVHIPSTIVNFSRFESVSSVDSVFFFCQYKTMILLYLTCNISCLYCEENYTWSCVVKLIWKDEIK